MSQAPERRYNDQDLKNDPYLITWAEAYAGQYEGEYAPMVEAGLELRSRERLSLRTARVVLNVARYDLKVQDRLPVPASPTSMALPERPGAPVAPSQAEKAPTNPRWHLAGRPCAWGILSGAGSELPLGRGWWSSHP